MDLGLDPKTSVLKRLGCIRASSWDYGTYYIDDLIAAKLLPVKEL